MIRTAVVQGSTCTACRFRGTKQSWIRGAISPMTPALNRAAVPPPVALETAVVEGARCANKNYVKKMINWSIIGLLGLYPGRLRANNTCL